MSFIGANGLLTKGDSIALKLVCQKIGNYVYRPIDPRNGETSYVRKGRNNRVFDHAAGLIDIESDSDQTLGAKLDRIKAIVNADLSVLHVIHVHEIPDDMVFEVEAALINAYPGVTNIQGVMRAVLGDQ